MSGESRINLVSLSRLFAATANRRFDFDKRGQLLISTHNETLSVVAICVRNPDCSPVEINRSDAAQTPAGIMETVCDDFPVPHGESQIDLRLWRTQDEFPKLRGCRFYYCY
jgi:hypothetical protein